MWLVVYGILMNLTVEQTNFMKTIKKILAEYFSILLVMTWLIWLWCDIDEESSLLTLCGTLCASVGVVFVFLNVFETINNEE